MMKTKNVLAIGLSIAGGVIFGALSGVAKVIQDDAYSDLKDMVKEKMKKDESEEGEAAE